MHKASSHCNATVPHCKMDLDCVGTSGDRVTRSKRRALLHENISTVMVEVEVAVVVEKRQKKTAKTSKRGEFHGPEGAPHFGRVQ